MRILKKDLKNHRIILRIETSTDLYILSNLIAPGDQLVAKTSRRIRRSGSDGRSGEDSQRITMTLGIEVEDFAFQDSSVSNRLRVKGKIYRGPEQHVSLGTYHTLNIELTETVTLIKPQGWTNYYLRLLEEAEEASRKPKICLIAVDKTEACIGLLDNYNLIILGQEKSHISRKLAKDKTRAKQTQGFFDMIIGIIDRKVLPVTKNIVIGGPGFIKERLATVLKEKFSKEALNIVIAGSLSGGNKVGLSELLQMEAIDKLAQDFRYLEDQRVIDEFLKRLNQGSTDISYGFQGVREVAGTGAIETVVLLDSWLQGTTEIHPEHINNLLHEIERIRGRISIVPSNSETASKLKTFGGIIALLRWSVPSATP
ncbi:MAG: mRNA surveillance protein pelota [Candidatus Heimdallarchaeota archaeon]